MKLKSIPLNPLALALTLPKPVLLSSITCTDHSVAFNFDSLFFFRDDVQLNFALSYNVTGLGNETKWKIDSITAVDGKIGMK